MGFLQLSLGDDGALDTVLVWPLIEESYVAIMARQHLGADHHGDRCDDELPAVRAFLAELGSRFPEAGLPPGPQGTPIRTATVRATG